MTATAARPTVVRPLAGHVSPDTAYVVDDYPYGFRLRCTMRHWLEYKKGHGFRHVTQTTNPKRTGDVWNTPKAGTYAPFLMLYLDPAGHVQTYGLGSYAGEERIAAAEALFDGAMTHRHRAALCWLRALNRAAARVTVTIRPDDGTPAQTTEEQAAIYRAVVADELRRDAA